MRTDKYILRVDVCGIDLYYILYLNRENRDKVLPLLKKVKKHGVDFKDFEKAGIKIKRIDECADYYVERQGGK